MNKVCLLTKIDTLVTPKGREATSNIRLEINGISFPQPRWNDFVLVVLTWWNQALLRLMSGVSNREQVDFMEGPYAVEVAISPSGILNFRADEGSARANEIVTGEELAMTFAHELITRSSEILDECKHRGWRSKGAETLESSSKALMKAAKIIPSNIK